MVNTNHSHPKHMILGDEGIECDDTIIVDKFDVLSDLQKTLIDSNLMVPHTHYRNRLGRLESLSTEGKHIYIFQ